jgi:membrane-bound inhibitor of C-type lysozyme
MTASAAAAAAPRPAQPPMNNFDYAFYTCDGGASFEVTYDSETPKTATLTTNDNDKQYVLARQPVADGVQFASGPAKFWTNGQKVVVDGTARPLQDCRMKTN